MICNIYKIFISTVWRCQAKTTKNTHKSHISHQQAVQNGTNSTHSPYLDIPSMFDLTALTSIWCSAYTVYQNHIAVKNSACEIEKCPPRSDACLLHAASTALHASITRQHYTADTIEITHHSTSNDTSFYDPISIISHHITSYHIISHHITAHHITTACHGYN